MCLEKATPHGPTHTYRLVLTKMATGRTPSAGSERFAGLILKGVKETGEEFGVGAYGRVFAVDYYGTVCAAKEVHSIE